MLTGRRLDAAQALACGLADEVVAADALDARLSEWLADLGRAEPAALRATKAILQHRRASSLADTLDAAALAFAVSLRSGTASEGLAAFAAKRPASWATTR
jgi:isohexenylglutaconyl-CoA hydratase